MPNTRNFNVFSYFPRGARNSGGSLLCLNETSVPFYQQFSLGEEITETSLDEAKLSLPFYWLLYEIKFNIQWSITYTPQGGDPITSQGSDYVNFNETTGGENFLSLEPYEKVCLHPWQGGYSTDSSSIKWDGQFDFLPFNKEKLHVYFLIVGTALRASQGVAVVVTSYPNNPRDFVFPPYNPPTQTNQVMLINTQTLNINYKNTTMTLYAYSFLEDLGYGFLGDTTTGNCNVSIENYDFWTPVQD